jgi:hypothetical protein
MPIVIVGAGLPSLQLRAPEAGATSFTERADWSQIPFLTANQTRTALVEPARRFDAEFAPEALRLLVEEAGGYPYAVQVLGRNAWIAAGTAQTITAKHAVAAIEATRDQLDDGLYGLRWNKCTQREKAVLTALAVLGLESGSDDISIAETGTLLGATVQQLSTQRDALIRKELIEPSGRGVVRFTLPGLGASILRTTGVTSAAELITKSTPRAIEGT